MKNTVLIVALKAEFNVQDLEFDLPVIFSGVGKLNASQATVEAIRVYEPNLVINLGTAGALTKTPGELLEISEVFQRDMDARPLSPRGTTPFQEGPSSFKSNFGEFKCGTGDSFVTEVDPWFLEEGIEVIDMELYAIAFVCHRYAIKWRSVKYITDKVGADSGDDWVEHLKLASNALHSHLPKLL